MSLSKLVNNFLPKILRCGNLCHGEERAEAIADRAIDNYTKQHIKTVNTLISDFEIRENLINELTNHPKLNPLESLNRKLVMHTDQSGIQSVENDIQFIEAGYIAKLAKVFTDTQKSMGFLLDGDKVKVLVKEIFGKPSGDPEISALAKSVTGALEDLRLHANTYGMDIKKLTNYGLPQSHSHYKVIQKGSEDWVNNTFPMVNRSKYRHENGSVMSETEVKDVLRAVYNTIASEGHNKAAVQNRNVQSETGLPMGSNMQNLHQETREVHFKDAEAWIEYQERYGEVNFHDLLNNHVKRMSTEIALMKNFGSNPEKMIKQLGHELLNDMMQDPKYVKKHDQLQKQAGLVTRHYDELAGQAMPIDSNLTMVGGTLRSLTVATKMGSATLTALGDIGTMKLAADMNGLAFTKILSKEMKLLKDKEYRDFAISIGLAGREAINGLVRLGENDIATASTRLAKVNMQTRKMANAVIKATGLNALTAANKRAFGIVLMHKISDLNSNKGWADLGSKDRGMLEKGGIKEDDWNIYKQIDRTVDPTGEKILTNKDVFNAPDDLFLDTFQVKRDGLSVQELSDQAFRLKEEVASRYMSHIYTETAGAVLEVGARETTFMGVNRNRGTVTNELTRFALQFKQFPMAMIMRHWTRAMAQESPQAKAVYLAKLFAYTSIMGGIVAQVQNITQGKDLDDPTTLDFFAKSIVKGGSASFLADAISAGTDPTDRGMKDFIIPAAFRDVINVGTMVSGAGQSYLDERESSYRAEAINTIKSNIPFQNVWYARLVFDRLVIGELQDMVDEDYREKRQRRQANSYGMSYWWDLDNENVRMPEMNVKDDEY